MTTDCPVCGEQLETGVLSRAYDSPESTQHQFGEPSGSAVAGEPQPATEEAGPIG